MASTGVGTIVEQVFAALAALETTGTATIGPITESQNQSFSIFGQKINAAAQETVQVTLTK
jgi:hypothetical protein